jgi:hypothetical protein
MPNIVYLYTSGGAPKCHMDHIPSWDSTIETTNRYAIAARSDGMINLFKTITGEGHVSRFTALIDSTVCNGSLSLGHNSTIHVIPSMACAAQIISPGDILIVRGGFKPWIPFLDYIFLKRQNWILFYRANTSRHAWPYWDITLNDLIDSPRAIRGRLHYDFTKPVNENIFGIIDAPNVLPREYDVMIGASHIHRKKGQYLTVQALQAHYRLFGTKPHAILPGGYMSCSTNQIIRDVLQSGEVDIEGPISVTRERLALLMNRSKLFVHSGPGGQNDRGILESMCCGCVPLIYGQSHVSPAIWDKSVHIPQDSSNMAQIINTALTNYIPGYDVGYREINGLHEVAIPKMVRLISFIEHHPDIDRRDACNRFVGGLR